MVYVPTLTPQTTPMECPGNVDTCLARFCVNKQSPTVALCTLKDLAARNVQETPPPIYDATNPVSFFSGLRND